MTTLFKRLNDSWVDLYQKFDLMGAKLLDIEIGLGDTHQKDKL